MAKIRKLKSPQQSRTQKLVLSITFFLSAALGVAYVIELNNHTDKFLVASRDLPAGSAITDSDAQVAELNLGTSANQYLPMGELPKGGYLLGPVRAGQLIPRSMLANAVIDERVPVVVKSAMGLPMGLVSGASVDVWVAPLTDDKVLAEPYVLVLGAEVSQLISSDEIFASESQAVELWVPIDAVGPVLSAIALEHRISLILRPTLADG
ncbi:MAG: hypothetical protein F2544_03800 [Actinobacteria bacterium]|jgi:hypothetical protein|uniref:Unannotated protein n=1 Tax=freshwater metagenome TaxID=449393 RepID=A0A6J6INW3_9ZZZZ|nr:hypothetical protein [Actinomycetota bacterium]MSZ22730.1 hypothetical protein [Actinomycetota bacterium]MTA92492.1 hypothetical protein [Actinomycetota bacterium]